MNYQTKPNSAINTSGPQLFKKNFIQTLETFKKGAMGPINMSSTS